MTAKYTWIDKIRAEVELAHQRNTRPRVHGNGFVQLDLTERRRLHVWGDHRIPRQCVPSTIHDHTFSFQSRVYVGQVIHRAMSIYPDPSGAFEMYQAVCNHGEDTRLNKRPSWRCNVLITEERLLRAGDVYTFQARKFHETVAPWPCVTVIDKDGPTLAQGGPNPNVLVPFGLDPDNTFDRYQVPPDLLWQIVLESLSPSNTGRAS